jgi:hypothetical protein
MDNDHNTAIQMKRMLPLLLLVIPACAPKSKYSYVVVDPYMQVVMETDDREKAYETAHGLTLMGRVLPSKPLYFVLEGGRLRKE